LNQKENIVAGRDVLRALDPHIQAEETGTAMIVFADNSLGRIYLNVGVPTSARYRSLEGMDALEACKVVDVLTVKFHVGTDLVRSRVMLDSNYEVIESLNNPAIAVPAVAPASRAVPPAQAAAAEPAITGPILSSSARQRLAALLTDYIGPVAPLVMTDLPATVDIETALSIVSREIDDTRRAADFVVTARQLLN
jgi:hypothetical protein